MGMPVKTEQLQETATSEGSAGKSLRPEGTTRSSMLGGSSPARRVAAYRAWVTMASMTGAHCSGAYVGSRMAML
jgi:hypothetical protein